MSESIVENLEVLAVLGFESKIKIAASKIQMDKSCHNWLYNLTKMTLKIRLFNHLQIQLETPAQDLTLRPRAQRLLVYLLLHRKTPVLRKTLAFTLWPDISEEESLGALRRALSDLRTGLPDNKEFLNVTRDKIGWNLGSSYWLDVDEFETYLQHDEPESLLKAVELYAGELLRDMDEEWLQPERERYRQMQFSAMRQLTSHHQVRREYTAALDLTRRMLALDPFSELVYQDRMRLHYLAGDRAAALAEYERLQSVLENEFGVEPMKATRVLAESITRGEVSEDKVVDASAITQIPPRLVGRDNQITKLLKSWDETLRGHGNLAIISGEAGIGKSHLVRTLAYQVSRRGGLPLVGQCYEFENTLPYQPIVEALRSVLSNLRTLPISLAHRSALARLLPEAFGEDATGIVLSSDELRVQLFEAFFQAFLLLAQRQPILLIFEDLHWASESVLDWLTFITLRLQRNRLMVALTYRTEEVEAGHALPRLARRFEREEVVTSMQLQRLSREINREWVAHLSGLDPSSADGIADRLFTETAGNPFFLQEIVRGMFETGQIQLEKGKWSGAFVQRGKEADVLLPESLRETILARTSRLSEMARSFLQAAATAGRTFHYEVVAHAGGWAEESSLNALEELGARGFIRESESRGDFVFTHHLLREAVYADLTSPRRVYWHLHLAKSIQTQFPDDYVSLAYHFAAAGEREMGIAYSKMAAERAEGLYAYEEASQHLRSALDLLGKQDRSDLRQVLLESLGDNYRLMLQSLDAISAYETALELVETASEDNTIIQTRLYRKIFQTVVSLWENARAETTDAAQKVSTALRPKVDALLLSQQNAVPHIETVNLLRALAMDAIIFHFHEENAQAFQFAETAVALARSINSPVVLSTALTTLATVYGAKGLMRERLEVTLQAMKLGRESGFDEPLEFIQVLIGAGSAFVAVGEYSRAISYFKEAEAIARQIRAIHDQIRALSLLHLCLFRLDRWDEMFKAEDARRALQETYPSWRLGAPCFAIGLSSAVHAFRGNSEASRKLKDESFSIMTSVVGSIENFRRSHHY